MSSKLVQADKTDSFFKPKVKRIDIAGHFVHVDDGIFAKPDHYWSDANDVQIAADNFAKSDKYEHLLIYGHGGLNSPADSANRILAMKETFKDNGIYPFHIMYDTGLAEEIKDVIFKKSRRSNQMAGGFFDWTDKVLEYLVARPGTLLWNEMKRDAKQAFSHTGAGSEAMQLFLKAMQTSSKPKKYHIVGHSTGAILFAHMLNTFSDHEVIIHNVFLLAPACKLSLYNKTYLPILKGKKKLKIKQMSVYNLNEKLEEDDNVMQLYRKSLLYLISNAFEVAENPKCKSAKLLGMKKYSKKIKRLPNQAFYYSNGSSSKKTRSKSHGGFDNDPITMNHILETILGKKPKFPFSAEILKDK